MSDFISREKLYTQYQELCKGIACMSCPFLNTEDNKCELESMILQAPTVDAESLITQHEDIGYERGYRDGYAEALEVTDDAEPVKHGHWVGVDDEPCNVWECDVCGWIYEDDEPYYRYCPHCGAKMEVENEAD